MSNHEMQELIAVKNPPLSQPPIENRRLESPRSNVTNYWTFALHANFEVFRAYWHQKTSKHGKYYGKHKKMGEFSTEKGMEIMKKFDSYIRYQIRAFNGSSKEFKKKMAHDGKTIMYLNEHPGVTIEEFYDLKLHMFIMDIIKTKIEDSFHSGTDFITIGIVKL